MLLAAIAYKDARGVNRAARIPCFETLDEINNEIDRVAATILKALGTSIALHIYDGATGRLISRTRIDGIAAISASNGSGNSPRVHAVTARSGRRTDRKR